MRGFPNILFLFETANQLICELKGKVCIRAKWPIRPELISGSVSWSDWDYFYSPLDGMIVHRRVTPSVKFAGTHLYTWVERDTVRVKCLAQEHNTMSPARVRTRSARFRVERPNHETTAPPTICESKSTEIYWQKCLSSLTDQNGSYKLLAAAFLTSVYPLTRPHLGSTR